LLKLHPNPNLPSKRRKEGYIYEKPSKAKFVHNKESNTAYNHQDVKVNPDPSPFNKEQKET